MREDRYRLVYSENVIYVYVYSVTFLLSRLLTFSSFSMLALPRCISLFFYPFNLLIFLFDRSTALVPYERSGFFLVVFYVMGWEIG